MPSRRRNISPFKLFSLLLAVAHEPKPASTQRSQQSCFLSLLSPVGPRLEGRGFSGWRRGVDVEVSQRASMIFPARQSCLVGSPLAGRCGISSAPRTRAQAGGGGGYGEIKGSRGTDGVEGTDAEEGSTELDAMWSRAAIGAREAEALRDITHPLDLVYAVMPEIQERLRNATGKEGFGAGYEDVPLGFYRDSNLKPMNWRDAVVSMKPGSGTKGLDETHESRATWEHRGRGEGGASVLLKEVVEEVLDEWEESVGDRLLEDRFPAIYPEISPEISGTDARRSYRRELGNTASVRVGTRYGGPPPGEHGPWRWGQLEPGSPLEKELRAEIASYPRRLPRRLRRYYQGKVAWVTGADRGLGERVAINLAVNGAKVILSGLSLAELERVQRLCILAWMKAVNWEISKAVTKGWTRLDRALVLPLDVRDDFILPDAARNAESMVGRPIDMVFHCAGTDVVAGSKGVIGVDPAVNHEARHVQVMEAILWGAVGLTKAVLPSMLDRQEGHIVAIAEGSSLLRTPEGRSAEAASRHAVRGYFDSLRAEVARDRIKVTVVHPGPMKPFATHLQEGTQRRSDPSREHDQNHRALDTDAVARKLLAAAAQGRQEVSVSKRGLFYGLQGVLGRWGFLRKDVHGRTM